MLLNSGLVAQEIPADPDALIALWRHRMAGKKTLLLLDDATGHQQVGPLLPGSAGSLVLITSRSRLTALEDAVFISLNTLAPGDAADLFVALAARPGLHPADPVVSEVIRLCGCLPLAIRLTAGRAAAHPARALEDLVSDLAAAQNRPALMRVANISVAAAIHLSYQVLTARQRRLFRRLGLHPGSDIDAYAAAALDGCDLDTARRHLDDLYNQHLIDEPASGRFRFHDLVSEHAKALALKSQAAQNEAAVRRLLDYYLRTATIADRAFRQSNKGAPSPTGPGQAGAAPDLQTYESALAWLEAERPNLAAAIIYAATHGESRVAAQISHAISLFAQRRGYWDQALMLHQVALACARVLGDLPGQATILNDLAVLHWMKGDYPSATSQLTDALRLHEDLEDEAGRADTFTNLGVVQFLKGDSQGATATLTEALRLCRSCGDQAREAYALISLAEVQSSSGDHPVTAWERALQLYSRLGDRRGQAYAHIGMGLMHEDQHDLTAAEASLSRALQLFQDLNDPRGEATVLIDIGLVYQDCGENASAITSWEKALSIFHGLGSPLGQAKALSNLGDIEHKAGNYPTAIAHLTEALRLFQLLGHQEQEAEVQSSLAELQRKSEG